MPHLRVKLISGVVYDCASINYPVGTSVAVLKLLILGVPAATMQVEADAIVAIRSHG